MSLPFILRINGRDAVSQLGLPLIGIGAAWSDPGARREEIGVPEKMGTAPAERAEGEPRRIPIRFEMTANLDERASRRDRIVRHLTGLVEIEWGDSPGRIMWARAENLPIGARWEDIAFIEGDLEIQVDLAVEGGAAFDRQFRPVFLPAGEHVEVDPGTSPMDAWAIVEGPVSDYRLAYHSVSGREKAAIALVAGENAAAGERLELYWEGDQERIMLLDEATGVRTSANSLYSSGSFPVVSPEDGSIEADVHPTMLASHDTILYTRRVYR